MQRVVRNQAIIGILRGARAQEKATKCPFRQWLSMVPESSRKVAPGIFDA
jgi:hypothetical protein